VITVLEYLVIAAAIGLVVFFLAAWVFGRGEQLAPLPARTSPAELPDGTATGEDVRNVRFAVGVRGYRMGDVDWTLDRLADELDRLRDQVRELGGDPDRERRAGELLPEIVEPSGVQPQSRHEWAPAAESPEHQRAWAPAEVSAESAQQWAAADARPQSDPQRPAEDR
jgi:DivIVA domain-containing protein